MTLDEALRRENNNADLLRLVAALAVIWGHAYALAPESGRREPIGRLLGFEYSGSLALEFFFFLSGLLVTNSWIKDSSPFRFVLARIFRIFPALILSAALCVAVLGPALTSQPITIYLSHAEALLHVLQHPHKEYSLPGLFEHNAYPQVNGSLWTISYELMMYMLLLGVGLCNLFKCKPLAAAIFIAVLAGSMFWPEYIELMGLPNVNMAGRLPAFFIFGALLALYKEQICIDSRLVAGLVLLAWIFRTGSAFQFLFYPAFLISALWAMSTAPVKALRLPGDFSYGVYVFGWPLQQTFASALPHAGIHINQFLTAAAALAIAAVSWFAVEKPCISLGRRISRLWRFG